MKQAEITESTLWIALRIMEERRNLLKKMGSDHAKLGLATIAESYKQKADDIQIHVNKMKEILYASQRSV